MPSVPMTAQWVDRVKAPASGQVDYFDSKFPSFGLRVSAAGRRSWILMYRKRGDATKRRMTIGTYPALTLADAHALARVYLVQIDRGEDPGAAKQEAKEAPTFADLAKEYIERYAKAHKRSWENDERLLNKEVVPLWGRRKAHDIKRKDVIALLDGINEGGGRDGKGRPIQANRTLALVRKVYNWAISRDIVEANPCAQVRPVAPERQRDRVLTEGEIKAVWGAIEQQELLVASMFKLRLLTAQRGGEVETMRWSDIDLKIGWWTIPGERAKNGLSHRVPLTPMSVAILEDLRSWANDETMRKGKEMSPWVFPSRTKKGHYMANIQKAADRVKISSGVDFVMHDLRRTAASYMTGMGVSRLVVSKLLNHVEQGITRVYDRHSYDAEKRQALEAWEARLREIISKPA